MLGTTRNNEDVVSPKYTATLSRSKGRSAFAVIFRHPLKKDRTGGVGVRVRRGLGTSDEAEATTFVAQLNELLTDESYWLPAARDRAAQRFERRVVAAFFDALEPVQPDSWQARGGRIPLPSQADGYVRALALGTTGAGKTTLVRQLIGTHPERDRFPSTSAAKTTVADHEIVLSPDGSFAAAVSFFPKDLVQSWVEDCVAAAVLAVLEDKDDATVSRRLLEHRDQRFRLSYTLGEARAESEDSIEDEDLDVLMVPAATPEGDVPPPVATRLPEYLGSVRRVAAAATEDIEGALGRSLADLRESEERDAFEELLESELRGRSDYHQFVDELLEDVELRFSQLEEGGLERGPDGWPVLWYGEIGERELFLQSVRRFSSNDSRYFGSLLTPLVDGIRVRGPFMPCWVEEGDLRLVLLDGEGIGHTAESLTSLPTATTKRFEVVDAVLLVDDASQPMLGASLTALRALVTSGHAEKLVFCFTHFDQVRGANLRTAADKQAHVVASAENAFGQIAKQLDRSALRPLQQALEERTVFLGNLHRDLTAKELEGRVRGTINQLRELYEILGRLATPVVVQPAAPVYDHANLVLAVQKGVQDFHEAWNARLGMPSKTGLRKEHWTRVRALTRYTSQFGHEGYDTLLPVADLVTMLRERLWTFVDSPLRWNLVEPDETGKALAVASVAAEVNRRLYDFARRRVLQNRFAEWARAFEYAGVGSSYRRAREIGLLYDVAAPVPGERPDPFGNEFLTEVRGLVREAIEATGGQLA